MLGGVFPLITDRMFIVMTFPGASSFLGGVVNTWKNRFYNGVPWLIVTIGSSPYHSTVGTCILWSKDQSEE